MTLMSKGYGGVAKKVCEDSKNIIYEYGGYNLNYPIYTNRVDDGLITIDKDCLFKIS